MLDPNSDTTIVITSCNRYDLLERTLDSLLKYNTYPVKDVIVSEDGPMTQNIVNLMSKEKYEGKEIRWFFFENGKQGQIKSIDRVYSLVETPYIFHCEDDWEFYQSGFIEISKEIMDKYPKVLQVWLRDKDDTNGHPHFNGIMAQNYLNEYHGFSFNPGLKRLSDYKLLGSYEAIANSSKHLHYESAIGLVYKNQNYYAAITPTGYVRHIGDNRHVW